MKPIIGIVVAGNPRVILNKHVLNTPYVRAIAQSGGAPLMIPAYNGITKAEDYIGLIDGLLLPGGEDVAPALYGEEPIKEVDYINGERDELEAGLLRLCARLDKPVLGICRGMQLMNVVFGGSLYQHIPSQIENAIAHVQDRSIRAQPTHSIAIKSGSRLYEVAGRDKEMVNSFHHQCIKKAAEGFDIVAFAPDGVAEAMENKAGTMMALQWHPEEMTKNSQLAGSIFTRFIKLAANCE